jgi:predicted metal-dependent enzyme (double-stranded beta helix superfamily)
LSKTSTEIPTSISRLAGELDAIAGQGLAERSFVRAAEPALRRLLSERDFLPKEAKRPSSEGYARHFLYADPQDRFYIAAMVWDPGQGTPIHDHNGTWGMIGMVQGSLEVVNYFSESEVAPGEVSLRSDSPHFPSAGAEDCVCGCADIHTVNNRADERAISVHIYAHELNQYLVFEPIPGNEGRYEAREKNLSYSGGAS